MFDFYTKQNDQCFGKKSNIFENEKKLEQFVPPEFRFPDFFL